MKTSSQSKTSILSQIKQEEKQAQNKIDKAKKQAETRIAQTRIAVQKSLKQDGQLSENELNDILKQAQEKNTAIKTEARETIKQALAELEQTPQNNINKAMDLVISKLALKHNLRK